MSFLKLDLGILDSSLWVEDAEVRIVFLTMLAMVDPSGLCAATAPGIARRANLPLDRVRTALAVLEAPDAESRTLDHEGRRVERVDGGYRVLNYLKYERKDHTAAARMRRYRARRRETVTPSRRHVTRNVTHEDVDVDVERDGSSKPDKPASEPTSTVLFEFPTVGKVRMWPFTREVRDQYATLYPTLNVEASARRALHWVTVVKPAGKKTARGMHRFLDGWFGRAVNKGEDLKAAGGNGARPAPSPEDLEALRLAREDGVEVTR